MALATVATTAPTACFAAHSASLPFTRWHRSLDDGWLALVVESASGRLVESVELDVRELPRRPELLARLGPNTRARLLADAAELARMAV
jgi:hypothetical protein